MMIDINAKKIDVEEIPCSITSLSFFDRFYDCGIARTEEGHLQRCFDEFYGDFTVRIIALYLMLYVI